MAGAFGELFEDNEAGTTIDIPLAGAFVKWVTASAGLAGPIDCVIVDAPNSRLVVGTNGGGRYQVIISATISGNTNSLKKVALFTNGVLQAKIQSNRHIRPAQDEGFVGVSGFIRLLPGDIVDLRFSADGNNDTVVLHHVNFALHALVRDIDP